MAAATSRPTWELETILLARFSSDWLREWLHDRLRRPALKYKTLASGPTVADRPRSMTIVSGSGSLVTHRYILDLVATLEIRLSTAVFSARISELVAARESSWMTRRAT